MSSLKLSTLIWLTPKTDFAGTLQFRHWRSWYSSWFWYKHRVITFLVAAAIISIKIVVMMKKCSFATTRTRGILSLFGWQKSTSSCYGTIRSKLVGTFTALIFLIAKFIFAIAVKFLRIVAFRAWNWYNFLHEDFFLSGGYLYFCKTLYHRGLGVLNFHLTLQNVNMVKEVKRWKLIKNYSSFYHSNYIYT